MAVVDVPEDRAVLSLNQYSGRSKYAGRYWALSTKELSLYHRKHKRPYPKLKQGKNDAYVLNYGNCTPSNLCQSAVTEEHKEYFRGVIESIKNSPMYDKGVMTSELVAFFVTLVGWKETA